MKQNNADIERMFRQHYERMYRLASRILMDADESRDVVSDVFAQLLADHTTLLPDTEEAYLMRSVRNRCLNLIAHKTVRERVARLLIGSEETATTDDGDETAERVRQIIDGLEPPLRRQILHLRHVQGLSYQTIADETGVSKVTVYHHLSQAMDTIKKLLKTEKQ